MPNTRYVDYKATNRLYENDDFPINDDDVTFPA